MRVTSAEMPVVRKPAKPHTPEHIPAELPKARTVEEAPVLPTPVGQVVDAEEIADAPEPPALLLGVEAAQMPAMEPAENLGDAPLPK